VRAAAVADNRPWRHTATSNIANYGNSALTFMMRKKVSRTVAVLNFRETRRVDCPPKGKICPRFVARYCVMNKAHLIYTAWTNPCLASERGLTVLYAGMCKFGPVNPTR
jgi:hypothetical protein